MKIRVVSPWYPDYSRPHSGIFVASQVAAIKAAGHDTVVHVPQVFPAPSGPVPKEVSDSMRALASRSADAVFHTVGDVTYVPAPVPSRNGPLGRAGAVAESLSMLATFSDDRPDLIHAHVGLPAGVAVARNETTVPLVVTEHWSGLAAALEDKEVAEAYSDLVQTAKGFICVSDHLKEQICAAIGDWARDRIRVIPNIVDLSDIGFRRRDQFPFKSWVYVGGLMQHKGVQLLVRAFEVYAKRHDQGARLTLVGDGPLRDWVEMYASSHGIGHAVELTGPVEHSALNGYLEAADVMVHLSPVETFGIASLEGIASGLPVVSMRNLGAQGSWGDLERECGALLDIGSTPGQVADAVAALRNSPGSLDIAAGRDMVEQRYAPEVVAECLSRVYEGAVR